MSPETVESAAPARAAALPKPLPRGLLGRLLPADAAGFGRLAAVLVGAMYLNIVSGAYVRLTASGLGCPDWPLCHGRAVPPESYHSIIEYSNRVIALAGISAAALTWLAARRRGRRLGTRLALGVLLLTLCQIPLGGITVYFHLHPVLVMSHFWVAVAALGLATALWAWPREDRPAAGSGLRALALLVGVLGAALVVSGAFSTAAGPHSGGIDIRRFGDWWVVTRTHVAIASGYTAGVVALTAALWRARWRPHGAQLPLLALLLLLPVQAVIGEYQRMNGLPRYWVLAHVAVAGALWIATVALATRVRARATALDRPIG